MLTGCCHRLFRGFRLYKYLLAISQQNFKGVRARVFVQHTIQKLGCLFNLSITNGITPFQVPLPSWTSSDLVQPSSVTAVLLITHFVDKIYNLARFTVILQNYLNLVYYYMNPHAHIVLVIDFVFIKLKLVCTRTINFQLRYSKLWCCSSVLHCLFIE
jgi:hypothetical protein